MNTVGIQTAIDTEKSDRWKTWILVLLLAFIFHLFLFLIHIQWESDAPHPPPVEVQQVDPKKLAQIRKQWRNQSKEKGLLLDQNRSKPSDAEAPSDARYLSDRNIHVDQEQKAKEHNVIPKPGRPNGSESTIPPKRQKISNHSQSSKKTLPKLGNLGVPFQLKSEPKKLTEEATQDDKGNPALDQPQGGQQYIADKNLPVGSENLLNAQESVFYSFYARLYETIGPIWQSRLRETFIHGRNIPPGDYTTSVDVVFDPEGNLLMIRRIESSGVPEFDAAVDYSWRKSPRFPNPPKGLLDGDRKVHTGWSFTVHVGDGAQFRLSPPERNY